MPIGATEDRVIGSLDLQRVLRDGEHAFSPGLLARAHGGVLYVDEVNLLHDHLVDVLLDAAAMGRVHIERDGVSHTHEARFVLIGTMNPEEGELRPQLLDRFGLTVDVRASRDVDVRAEVIRAPDGTSRPTRRLRRPLRRATTPTWPAGSPRRAHPVGRCGAAGQRVTPHRGAVCGVRRRRDARRPGGGPHRGRARRLARSATPSSEEDIRVAAELALPHRRRRDPFDDPGLDPEQLDDAMAQAGRQPSRGPRARSGPAGGGGAVGSTRIRIRSDCTAGVIRRRSRRGPARRPPAVFRTRALVVPGVGEGAPGRRSRARNRTGRPCRRPTDPEERARRCTCSPRCWPRRAGSSGRAVSVRDPTTCAARSAEGREGNLVIFVVDASGSMAARDRMAAVSGAALSLLRDAYQRRDKVAVITFRGSRPRLLLPPTSSVHIAGRRLARFDTGGKTPLAQGLLAARDVVVREKARDRARRSLVVVLTDGRATGGPDPLGRARVAAARLVAEGAAAVVVDCETSYVRLGLAEELASQLGAPVGAARAAAGRRPDADRPDAVQRRLIRRGDSSMPQGHPLTVPDDGLTTRARRNAPLLAVHTGAGQGKVDRRVRDGAAGLEPGLRRRGVPVRQERQVEGGRGGGLS